jgi:hypothetical protein
MDQIPRANAKFNSNLSLTSFKDEYYDVHFFVSSRRVFQYDLTTGIIYTKHTNFQYVVSGV